MIGDQIYRDAERKLSGECVYQAENQVPNPEAVYYPFVIFKIMLSTITPFIGTDHRHDRVCIMPIWHQ